MTAPDHQRVLCPFCGKDITRTWDCRDSGHFFSIHEYKQRQSYRWVVQWDNDDLDKHKTFDDVDEALRFVRAMALL